jgi:hypothetical protein
MAEADATAFVFEGGFFRIGRLPAGKRWLFVVRPAMAKCLPRFLPKRERGALLGLLNSQPLGCSGSSR